ncbi:MAG TPA: methyltransferase domain-containing protein [Anaeromyxobacteraceae bacterium]|nr:methyltransferase domain-containing protein [Anaeromyxobacteraceae bacterium]
MSHDHANDHRPHGHAHGHPREHQHGAEPGRDRFGNPEDLAAYLEKLESPERAEWQKPDEVVAALGLAEGSVAADVGAGPGYFTLRLARAVGPAGKVYGVDVEPRMTQLLEERARAAGLANVVPVLAPEGDGLPPERCDLILLVNAFHHFHDGAGYLRRLGGALAPGGRVALVEFHEGDLPVGPPPEHRVTRATIDAAVRAAGLRVVAEHRFLPYQHLLLLAP